MLALGRALAGALCVDYPPLVTVTRSKLVEAATALLEGAGGSLPITSLNKALFYLDLQWLLEHGDTLTGTTYMALKAGPVVAKYEKRVIDALEEFGLAQQDEADDGLSKPVCLVAEPNYVHLTLEQQSVAKRIGAKAAHRSPSWLSEFSHQNTGWRIAWDAGLGAKRPAVKVDLRIAMQQLVDEDPWLEQAPDADLAGLFRSADDLGGTPW